jgi:DNA-binding SARP family transcriptional activator/tetratricopeptide (TPR) repeat protein
MHFAPLLLHHPAMTSALPGAYTHFMLLHTLGELRLEGSAFQRSKALLLLTYLALEGSQERQFLAHLFWGRMDNALGNLAVTLARLKKAALDALETDNIYAKTTIQTDTQAFETAFSNKAWHKVLKLYKGSFLQGVHSDDWGTEVEEWVYQKREAFAAKAREALLQVAEEEAKNKHFDSASQYALKAYHLKAAPEPELQDLERLYLLLRAGNDVHAKDVSKEARGFGLDLHLSEDEARKRLSVPSSAKFHTLPFQATAFIGREVENKQLAQQLRNKACRLLTIVGPGGIGKTRLAIASAGEHIDTFDDGVCFVSFAAVASADLMVYTLADALKFSLVGQRPPKDQVLEYLKNKKMLLVLDNLEHLLSGVDLISEILATSAEIKILATSRERLGLQGEHLFDLHGLTLPDEQVQHSDALQLFAERAKHHQLDFVLDEHFPAVTNICQLVSGMPLAIELAAGWSRLLSPNEILQELELSLDLLSSSAHDLPERHHSMQTVFETSWQRLTEDEQTALRKLSVFVGGFDREAAREIAQITLPTLLALVNKSFVWRDTSGRFSQHPLILQYAQHKAQEYPEERKQSEEKHGLYYLELVKEKAPKLRTQQGKEVREVLDNELPNIRAAWDWTLRETRVEEIRRSARAISHVFYEYLYEGTEMFKRAVAALDEHNPAHHAALGYALIHQTNLELYLNNANIEACIKTIGRSLDLLEPLAEYSGIVTGKTALAVLLREQGKFAEAKEALSAALELARAYGDPSDIGTILVSLAMEEKNLGHFSEVSVLMQTTLAELRELGDVASLIFGLTVFGSYLVDNDRLDEGEKLIRESLALVRESNWYLLGTLADLARLAYKRRNFQEAASLAQEAFERALQSADEFMKATNLALLGRIKLAQGQLAEAEQLLVESLRLGWFGKKPLAISHSLVFLAELSIAQGQVKQGVSLLSFLSHHQAIEKRDRDEALKLLETARQQVSPRAFAQAQEESKTLKLETVVLEILEGGRGA